MFYQKEIKDMKDFSLLVMDMDSTLINFEVIDELAREANVLDEVSAITESAMRGDINFKQSLMKTRFSLCTSPKTDEKRHTYGSFIGWCLYCPVCWITKV